MVWDDGGILRQARGRAISKSNIDYINISLAVGYIAARDDNILCTGFLNNVVSNFLQ